MTLLGGVSNSAVLVLLLIPVLLALYYVNLSQPEKSPLEVVPTMPDLHSLTWNNSGKLEQLKVIEMCTSKHKCEDLGQILGQPESHLTPPVKRVPSSCCLAVFQRWLVCSSIHPVQVCPEWSSIPKNAYPITWRGVINVLKDAGLEDGAKLLEKALPLWIH